MTTCFLQIDLGAVLGGAGARDSLTQAQTTDLGSSTDQSASWNGQLGGIESINEPADPFDSPDGDPRADPSLDQRAVGPNEGEPEPTRHHPFDGPNYGGEDPFGTDPPPEEEPSDERQDEDDRSFEPNLDDGGAADIDGGGGEGEA